MAAPGRPFSSVPKDSQIGIRLTEEKIAHLYLRKKPDETLADMVRCGIDRELAHRDHMKEQSRLSLTSRSEPPGTPEPENETALIKRHERAARRGAQRDKRDAATADRKRLIAQNLEASGESLTS